MKHLRLRKNKKQIKRIMLDPSSPAERVELDKNIFDMVLRKLYENPKNVALDLEKDIFQTSNFKLPQKESQRIWDVLTSTGWITPAIGFGKAGKIELTKAGFQLMAQFGGYSQYLASVQSSLQPQTIIMPIQIEADDTTESTQLPAKTGLDRGRTPH
jgi:hypothetical protein